MEGGSPVLEWITYGILGVILFALGYLFLRTARFFLSLLLIPVLGALGRTRAFGGLVRRWGERGPAGGLPVMGASDEAAVDEAAAAVARVRIPRAVTGGARLGAALGAAPGVWYAAQGGWAARVGGEPALMIAGHVAFALCLVGGAGVLVGSALGALAGVAVDAGRARRSR